jgi:uncharacterized Zn ribbon protein
MNQISLHRDDVETILQFIKKYPEVEYVTVTSDTSSGIGSITDAAINTIINGDSVTLIKHIVDESSW